ncbi:54S ribosomal protein IMG2, mitochondrial [Vanrija pseudolonga]|uniref:Large ribosomal subunit protein mL49 n=1 Tax=Vanrija pseudolonga TaxID=143232 RepID=A0AAF0YA53_9TREE|nr:54S ribosomal protein IMG2, mitochondrial [Vanrija pseudolonga]
MLTSAATTSRRALLLARTVPAAARASSASASASASSPSPDAAARPVEVSFTPKYIVERTSTGQLPVYSDFRNGGNATTVVRRVKGNVLALRQDLANYLADGHIDPISKPPSVVIKPTSKQIEVRGRWVEEVKGWLEMRGF